MKLEELRENLVKLNGQAHDLLARAEAEKRDLTVEETEEFDRILAESDRTKQNIERLEAFERQTEDLRQGTGRRSEPEAPAGRQQQTQEDVDDATGNGGGRYLQPKILNRVGRDGNPRVPAQYDRDRGNGGFRSLGEMAFHVARACRSGGITDPRLERLASATTYGSEGSGADGGFAVPVDFRTAIMEAVMGEDSLLPRCDQITVSGNTFTCPYDMTTPWQSTGGVQAYWDGEAAAATQSKPALEERTIKLNKIRALVPMTEELLEDASAMDAYLRRKAPTKIAFKISLAILQGTGVGQPLGLLNSPALVTVSKEGSQVADTLVANNVIKMYSRMYAPSRSKAVWLINQDLEPQLLKLSIPGTDNTGNAVTGWGGLVYLPANGLSGSPFGTLFGRPVIPTQACETLGDLGDIFFADLSQYLALLKSGPNPRVDVSMHLWFDQDLAAFKFVLRMGGMPWWSSAISARDGSATYSPFVTLESR
jgi:HK97 family phage major capsid protein